MKERTSYHKSNILENTFLEEKGPWRVFGRSHNGRIASGQGYLNETLDQWAKPYAATIVDKFNLMDNNAWPNQDVIMDK
ncbi:hypothetical protein TNCV_4534241 [Trichonephila clavipes]|nr:hypothetical protein TNCV_4534241 [Trichonephila clavipes]